MVSDIDAAKRTLVTLIRSIAAIYSVVIVLTRQSTDVEVRHAFKKVARRAHPDKGGTPEHQKAMNAARDAWENLLQARHGQGGDRKSAAAAGKKKEAGVVLPVTVRQQKQNNAGYRFQGEGVLLTYQKFSDIGCWQAFRDHVVAKLAVWKARYWCATMERNADGTYHIHLMLQFRKALDRFAATFAFAGVRPNARSNDLLGEGFCKKKIQQSLDRGFFYVWANKEGTARGEDGQLLVAGNYEPAWTRSRYTYTVAGSFLDKLFRAYKLSEDVYEEYVYLARDGVNYRKKNLDACRERARELKMERDIAERVKRIRADPALYQPFKPVPEAQAWLRLFEKKALRYPLLVAHAPSYCGKTEWAISLFQRPLELKVGTLQHFPEAMRRFDKDKFDGLVLDDVRDLAFLSEHQEKLQGKYSCPIEFASTPGGQCAYWRDLFRVPVVVTVNDSTKNLALLKSGAHDFLGKTENVFYLRFGGRPGEVPPSTCWSD